MEYLHQNKHPEPDLPFDFFDFLFSFHDQNFGFEIEFKFEI